MVDACIPSILDWNKCFPPLIHNTASLCFISSCCAGSNLDAVSLVRVWWVEFTDQTFHFADHLHLPYTSYILPTMLHRDRSTLHATANHITDHVPISSTCSIILLPTTVLHKLYLILGSLIVLTELSEFLQDTTSAVNMTQRRTPVHRLTMMVASSSCTRRLWAARGPITRFAWEHSPNLLTCSLPRVINFKFPSRPPLTRNITSHSLIWRTWLFIAYHGTMKRNFQLVPGERYGLGHLPRFLSSMCRFSLTVNDKSKSSSNKLKLLSCEVTKCVHF